MCRWFYILVALSVLGFTSCKNKDDSPEKPEKEAPPVPALVSPLDGADDIDSASVLFQWDVPKDIDVKALSITYLLFLDKTPSPTTKRTTNPQTETSFTVSNLEAETKYYWYVQVSDANGNTVKSKVRNFTTKTALPVTKYPQGLFLLKHNNEIDFKHNNGTLEENIFGANNNNETIPTEEDLMEIIPHKKGFLIITDKYSHIDSERKGFIYFTDETFKVIKKHTVSVVNYDYIRRYAIIGSKIYYATSVGGFLTSDKDRSYIIDIEKQTVEESEAGATQYLSDSKGNLYSIDPGNNLNAITDKTDLTNTTQITSFHQRIYGVVITSDDVVLGAYKEKPPFLWFAVYDSVSVERYDLNTKQQTTLKTTETFNIHSKIGLNHDRSVAYIITGNKDKSYKHLYKITSSALEIQHKLPYDTKVKERWFHGLKDGGFLAFGKLDGIGLNGNNQGYYQIDTDGAAQDVEMGNDDIKIVIYNYQE